MMRLWKNWYVGNPKRAIFPYQAHVALAFQRTRIVWSTFGAAPIWAVGYYVWRSAPATWVRLQDGTSVWWCGQKDDTLVIVGRGRRPALILSQDGWTGVVPSGRGAAVASVPSASLCQARFSASGNPHHQQIAR